MTNRQDDDDAVPEMNDDIRGRDEDEDEFDDEDVEETEDEEADEGSY
jgi:hypothetical protein